MSFLGTTVDGSLKSANQLRLVVYPTICRVSYFPGVGFQPSTVRDRPGNKSFWNENTLLNHGNLTHGVFFPAMSCFRFEIGFMSM